MELDSLINYKQTIINEYKFYITTQYISKKHYLVFKCVAENQLYNIRLVNTNTIINNLLLDKILYNLLNDIINIKINILTNYDINILTNLDFIIALMHMNYTLDIKSVIKYINLIIKLIEKNKMHIQSAAI